MGVAPIISIVGPTAVGKTSLALWLAEELLRDEVFEVVDLISADSRQVYKGLEITTGADVPPDFQLHSIEVNGFEQSELLPPTLPFFQKGQLRWHGVSLVSPEQSWSMSHFRQLVEVVTKAFNDAARLIILVGGTGLYHEYATSSDPQLFIPPNEALRESLEGLTVPELQAELARRSPEKAAQLNESDRHNPRRLVRAIEIAVFKEHTPVLTAVEVPSLKVGLTLGVQSTLDVIEAAVHVRVEERLDLGAVSEVQKIWAQYPNPTLPAYSATGVKDILAHIQGQLEWSELSSLWALHEFQYAKRQLTWWKKRTEVVWCQTTDPTWHQEAKELFSRWLVAKSQ